MTAVGILGGGQLGLMLAESLEKLGQHVLVLEPDADAPCARRMANVTRRSLDDTTALAEFFAACDVATYDSENLPSAPLAPYSSKLSPSLSVLQTTQHRALEKEFLARHGFAPVRFAAVKATDDLAEAVKAFGLPCIVKSSLGGYDGKGQWRVRSLDDLGALPRLGTEWVLEEILELEGEVSCVVARDAQGQAFPFPVFENLHADHVLDVTVVPARVDPALQEEAKTRALAIAKALDVVGLLTVEFFIGAGRDGQRRLYVNELAPRVHNSGHVTRQACTLSQFDALARILSGVPLSTPSLHAGAWCMGNLLGDVWLAQGRSGGALDLSAWRHFPNVVDVYLYGKREARAKRKMGHFVVHAQDTATAVQVAHRFRAALIASR